jgi:Amt family ammonium transporter
MMFILFSILKALGLYRVDPIEEEVGLDISRHMGPAYDTHTSVSPDAVEELNKSRSKSGFLTAAPEKVVDDSPAATGTEIDA